MEARKTFFYTACEICGVMGHRPSDQDSVCKKCDKILADKDKADLEAKAAQWAQKRKCRACGEGLPLSRYYKCEGCEPTSERPLHDPMWELIGDDEDSEAITTSIARARRDSIAKPKACIECKVVKSPEHFPLNGSKADGILGHCRQCDQARKRVYNIKKKEREAALVRLSMEEI